MKLIHYAGQTFKFVVDQEGVVDDSSRSKRMDALEMASTNDAREPVSTDSKKLKRRAADTLRSRSLSLPRLHMIEGQHHESSKKSM